MPFFPRLSLLLVTLAGLLGSGCVRQSFFQPDARPSTSAPLPLAADSVFGVTAGRQYARHGGLYRALVGQHHRPSWAAPVNVPVLHLATVLPGGLQPGKVGGGFNSTSLGLNGSEGPGYVVRTVDKDPIRATPQWLRRTFLVNVLRDNVSSTNPYAALVVPPLAAALGVAFSSPRLFYVRPDDPAFQTDSLRHFRGQLAALEEKAAVLPAPVAAAQSRVLNSHNAFAAVFAHPATRLDQPALLRARLLDAWLGDWDRHAGQWSWALVPAAQTGASALVPLPKDRDMVFYRLDDGALGWLTGHVLVPHWATFGARFGKFDNLLASGEYLDKRGLNALTRKQFRAAAEAMQQQLPDTLIERAVRRLPPAVFALEGPRTIAALQARRAALPELAEAFYAAQARYPVVGGTAQAERFEVHRYADSTVVAVFAAGSARSYYRRAFLPSETRRIQLEALAGDDVFVVEEHGSHPAARPKLRLYGGPGTNELRGSARHGIRYWPSATPAKNAYNKAPEE